MSTPIAQLYSTAPPLDSPSTSQTSPVLAPSKPKFIPPPPIVPPASLQGEDPFGGPASPASPPLGGEPWRVSLSDDCDSASVAPAARPSTDMEESTFQAEQKRERQQKLSFLKGLLGASRRRSSLQVDSLSPNTPTSPATSMARATSLHKNPSMSSLPNRISLSSATRVPPPPAERRSLSERGNHAFSTSKSAPASPRKGGFNSGANGTSSKGMDTVRKIKNKIGEKTGNTNLSPPTIQGAPDNARSSVFSAETATSLSPSYDPSESGPRSTMYSAKTRDTFVSSNATDSIYQSFAGGRSREEVADEEELYDPLQEDGDAVSIGGSKKDDHDPSRPRIPPPKQPVPPLPTPRVNIGRSPSESSPNLVPNSTSAKSIPGSPTAPPRIPIPPLPPARSPLRPPPIPLRPSSRAPSPSSPSGQRSAHSPRQESLGGGSSSTTPSKTIATLYLVAGLPKDPTTWTLSEPADGTSVPAHSEHAVPRYWRPEILGCTVTGEGSEDVKGLNSLDGNQGRPQQAKPRNGARKESRTEDLVVLTKEEISRIQGKVIKLCFNRDIEILASTSQPPSTSSVFSFKIPAPQTVSSSTTFQGPTAAAWEAVIAPTSTSTSETTFYAACLTVWSHADATRSAAIRATLEGGGRAKASAIRKAAKAASVGKKLGRKLEAAMNSALGPVPAQGRSWTPGGGAYSDTEGETDGFATESEWGETIAASVPLAPLPNSVPFFLPYSLIIVSQSPIYNLLNDLLRLSYARYHHDVGKHSLHMHSILHYPAPKPGERIRLPVSADAGTEIHFVATMPGNLDWTTGAALDQNFAFWPIFKALDANNLLTIAEVALSPLGRVVFISKHSIMLGLATSVFQFILELRGWRGIVHSSVHVRDLKIYLDDPGPFLMAVSNEVRALALNGLASEIAVVDIDANMVTIKNPHPKALSTGTTREKARRRLELAIGNVGYYSVPVELTEAFPGGRFRPFSDVEIRGVPSEGERLRPAKSWDWDQSRTIAEFDAILSEAPRTTLLSRILRTKAPRRIQELDPGAKRVQNLVRSQAAGFIDRRDVLESKINRLNAKLAYLMSESKEWQASFDVFQAFSDKLTKESSELKTRLEKERREANRLNVQVSEEKERQAKLEASLLATESAREEALLQLANVQAVRTTLEQQQNLIVSELQAVLMADESSPIYEAVYQRLEALSHQSETSSRPGTSHSIRSTGSSPNLLRRASLLSRERLHMPGSIAEDDEDSAKVTDHGESEPEGELSDEARLEAMKLAVDETLQSIKTRLAIVLENAEQLDPSRDPSGRLSPRGSISHSLSSPRSSFRQSILPSETGSISRPFIQIRPDSPPPSAILPDAAGLDEIMASLLPTLVKPHNPKRFTPKRLTLTPPVSPENLKQLSQQQTRSHSHSASQSSRRGHNASDSIISMSSSLATSDSANVSSPAATIRSLSDARADSPFRPRSRATNSSGRTTDGRGGPTYAQPESRASNYDDDSQSFVSAEGYDSSTFYSDDDDEEIRYEQGYGEGYPSRSSSRMGVPISPLSPISPASVSSGGGGSVELFTRTGSTIVRSPPRKDSLPMEDFAGLDQGGLRPAMPSGGQRPISAVTVRPSTRQI